MPKAQSLVSALLLVLLLIISCTPQAAPLPAPQAPAPTAPVTAPAPKTAAPIAPGKAAWEIEWEKTLAAARQEGVVAFGTSTGSEARRDLSESFKNKFGLRVESIVGTAGSVMSKILAERRAGLYLWDVLVAGSSAHMSTWKPAGGGTPLEPALILPDLTDPEVIKKVWYGGKLPWVDREHTVIGALLYVSIHLGINTNLVKPGEIKTYDDLLNPKWKGKILFMDPTLPGTNNDGGLMLLLYEDKGEDWVRKFAAQEPVIIRDDRLAHDWLAHGKNPIYLPTRQETLLEFMKAGAPVGYVLTEDIMQTTAGVGGVSLIDRATHPNAAKIFINWVLGKEGISIISKNRQSQSARVDVSTDFLHPDFVRKPGVKYSTNTTEELLNKIADYRVKSKEIFGNLLK